MVAVISIVVSIVFAFIELFVNDTIAAVVIIYIVVVLPLVILPRLIFWLIREAVDEKWLKWIDYIIFAFIVIGAPGTLMFHRVGVQYDRFIHFGSAFFAFSLFILVYLPIHAKIIKREPRKKFIILLSFFVLFAGLFLWEGFQYVLDGLFNTHLFFFDSGQDIKVDFWEDIIFSFAGLILAVLYARRSFDKFLSVLK